MEIDQSNPWRTLSSEPVYDNAWIRVREDQVIRPDGRPGIYGVVHMKNRAVGVVPLHDDGTVTLVGQYRYTLDTYSWEIPEGGCPPGEDPLATAHRELLEETGLRAAEVRPLGGELHLSNSICDELGYLFVATGLTQGDADPEGTEKIAVRRVPFQKALDMALNGQINDHLSVTALALLALRGDLLSA